MSVDVKATVVGAEGVQHKFTNVTPAVRKALRDALYRLAVMVQARAKEKYLSLPRPGPGGLAVRTGTLRRSINIKMRDDSAGSTASIGTNVIYGKFWELGFHKKNVQVGAHVRGGKKSSRRGAQIGQRVTFVDQGIMGTSTVRGAKTFERVTSQRVSFVKASTRNFSGAPRPFLKPALDDVRPMVRAELLKTIMGLSSGRSP